MLMCECGWYSTYLFDIDWLYFRLKPNFLLAKADRIKNIFSFCYFRRFVFF